MRKQHIQAVADHTNMLSGVAVVGSFQMRPPTDRPFKIRGDACTPSVLRTVEISLTRDEAKKLVNDWISMGLFGSHGRVVTTKKAA